LTLAQLGFGLNPSKILQVRRPYNVDDYPFDQDSTVLVFVVGEKDWDRFNFDQRDPESGLVMQKRDPSKPGHIQAIDTMGRDPLPMNQRAYVMLMPDVQDTEGDVASASALRKQLKSAPDIQTARRVFQKFYGEYNEQLFNLIYSKIAEPEMTEQNQELSTMRKLAGLPENTEQTAEAAPVEYYGVSDQERLLAALGRTLMKQAEQEKDDEMSNIMARVGQKFTVYGAPGEPDSLRDLAIDLGMKEDAILKFAEFAQKIYDRDGEVGANDQDDVISEPDDAEELFAESEQMPGDEYITKRVVGHHDNEARMMQRDLLKIRDYADELVQALDGLQDGDFPHWWQAKVVKAANYMSAVKHFLDGEQRLGPRDHIGHNQVDMGPVADEVIGDQGIELD